MQLAQEHEGGCRTLTEWLGGTGRCASVFVCVCVCVRCPRCRPGHMGPELNPRVGLHPPPTPQSKPQHVPPPPAPLCAVPACRGLRTQQPGQTESVAGQSATAATAAVSTVTFVGHDVKTSFLPSSSGARTRAASSRLERPFDEYSVAHWREMRLCALCQPAGATWPRGGSLGATRPHDRQPARRSPHGGLVPVGWTGVSSGAGCLGGRLPWGRRLGV